MKNILYQLGDTAANLDGATPAQTGAIGMNPSTPAVTPAVAAPAPAAAPAPVVAPAPVNATAQNFSPQTQNSADYIYGSEESRGY